MPRREATGVSTEASTDWLASTIQTSVAPPSALRTRDAPVAMTTTSSVGMRRNPTTWTRGSAPQLSTMQYTFDPLGQ